MTRATLLIYNNKGRSSCIGDMICDRQSHNILPVRQCRPLYSFCANLTHSLVSLSTLSAFALFLCFVYLGLDCIRYLMDDSFDVHIIIIIIYIFIYLIFFIPLEVNLQSSFTLIKFLNVKLLLIGSTVDRWNRSWQIPRMV